jgi:hypothetical protein
MPAMTDRVTINDRLIRVKSFHRRPTPATDGQPAGDEVEVVVMLRGRGERRDFETLLRTPKLVLAIPDGDSLGVQVSSAAVSSSGSGEKDAHRFDVTFRESEDSAARRAAVVALDDHGHAGATPGADRAEEVPADTGDDDDVEIEDVVSDGRTSDLGGSSVVWATALRQLSHDAHAAALPPPIEQEFTSTEQAGIESILVGLRLEALITLLDDAGIVRRGALDDAFLDLVDTRFVAEATPLIGEKAARAAARAVLGG